MITSRKLFPLLLLPLLLLSMFPAPVEAAGMTCTISATPSPQYLTLNVKVVGTWSAGIVQPVIYTITYGDGTSFSSMNASLSGSITQQHNYTYAGIFTLTFNAHDSGAGSCSQVSTTVQILPYKVIACTSFQFACWAYPFAFWMFYIIVFVMIAGTARASTRGTTYLLLVGWDYSSLVMVMMGLLPITMPLILTALLSLYMVRFR